MLLKTRVKAGILLHALLMSAIFALFLQFYLSRLVAVSQQYQVQLKSSQAYLMAQLTSDMVKDKVGKYQFNLGKTSYHRKGKLLEIETELTTGQTYRYQLLSQQSIIETEKSDTETESYLDKKEK